ncbi:MAG: outer membrane protein assembly factor BamA [Azoarcus sp.]|jgi:outer membrane protein insertion porin family|nr:outer membrane protein assembly factor BamA [Azoarcus sp.]
MIYIRFVGLVAALLVSMSALAFQPFVVKDIRVEGLQRTEAGTVFNYLPVKVGDMFDEAQASEAIRALFNTGFFRDVRIETDHDVLVVVVDERPAIARIDFVGVKDLDGEALKKGLRDVDLAESRTFDRALLDRAEQEIKRQYLARGKFGATVTTTVTPLERNRVGITFNVDEGDVARIRQIKILGSKAFKESTLIDLFELSTPGWLTWYTKRDRYSRQQLAADLERLRSHYLDRGYLDFDIESTQVSITPDKKDIYITVNLREGERYTVTDVRYAGTLVLSEEEYLKLTTIRPGEIFSRQRLTETTKAITDRLGNEGYAFANVNAAPEMNEQNHEVAFTIYVDPGRKVYVRRINVQGNARTRDEVIRREVRQMESAWYDGAAISRSRDRIDRLGFFDEVTIETPPVAETTDQVDVNFSVKERRTGNLTFGVGYSSVEKAVFQAAVSDRNMFGSGKNAVLAFNTSKSARSLSLSLTDPFFTIDGVSLGGDIYYDTYDPLQNSSLSLSPYKKVSAGAGLRVGYPIAEDDSISFGLAFDRTRITVYDRSYQQYKDFCVENNCNYNNSGKEVRNETIYGEVDVNSLILSMGWGRDTRNSYLYPTKGTYQRIYGEIATAPADLRYGKLTYQFQHWLPVGRRHALMFNTEFGWAKGYGDKSVPFYKNFYAGGINSVRGFETYSLGPRDGEDNYLGGTRKFIANLEFFFPMPGSGSDQSFRFSTFVDAGYVWGKDLNDPGKDQRIRASDLRYSAGVALTWNAPIGPLKFSLGYPLKKKCDMIGSKEVCDKTRPFDFLLGATF